ncbi:hypothetical protein CEXT_609831 [Caerostris extrusa]|uniref:Uncharacterized protein n=1 Tax=Caerostris extrusa TaxID=172846 RepID=A0AAV4NSZ0_CAEEX|nr:hypothetical protein CEXT_609831 [Caerostris extrusa]
MLFHVLESMLPCNIVIGPVYLNQAFCKCYTSYGSTALPIEKITSKYMPWTLSFRHTETTKETPTPPHLLRNGTHSFSTQLQRLLPSICHEPYPSDTPKPKRNHPHLPRNRTHSFSSKSQEVHNFSKAQLQRLLSSICHGPYPSHTETKKKPPHLLENRTHSFASKSQEAHNFPKAQLQRLLPSVCHGPYPSDAPKPKKKPPSFAEKQNPPFLQEVSGFANYTKLENNCY